MADGEPGLPYLDIVQRIRARTQLPVAVYHVSGEYAMLRAVSANRTIPYDAALLESLAAMKRAGADYILTYGALDAARVMASAPPLAEPMR